MSCHGFSRPGAEISRMNFLPGQNFDCEGCTKCCRGWRIRVDDASRPEIERTQGKHMLQVRDGAAFTQKQADGSCVFLQADRCAVHAIKPAGCRLFPFRAVRTPDGVFVGVSFYCSAVQSNTGRSLEEHAEALQPLLENLPLIGADPLLVHGNTHLNWDGYRALDDFLVEGTARVAQALWAVCQLRGVADAAAMRSALAAAEEATAPPNEPFFVAERHHACALLAKLEGVPVDSLRAEKTLKWQGWSGKLSELAQPPENPLLERYVRALVFRKFLITRRPLLSNVAALHLVPALFAWCAALSRVRRKGATWEPVDFQAALDRCEYSVFTHGSGYDELFEEAGEEFLWSAT